MIKVAKFQQTLVGDKNAIQLEQTCLSTVEAVDGFNEKKKTLSEMFTLEEKLIKEANLRIIMNEELRYRKSTFWMRFRWQKIKL